jgi:SAM-dependent methyltransferase
LHKYSFWINLLFMVALYDTIEQTYSGHRQSDPRIQVAINSAIEGCGSILNVGAGAGSYEPNAAFVVALEPSRTMIAQRPPSAAHAIQGKAEALPFADQSFDAFMGVLTAHHWTDQGKGFSECARVARLKVALVTIDMDVCARFWLYDYFPGLLLIDRQIFPRMTVFSNAFASVEFQELPIPGDCIDGFLCAYWKRPEAYLDPLVRASISTFSRIGNIDEQLKRLKQDLESGLWEERYPQLKARATLDLGYRLVVAKTLPTRTRN